MPLEDLMEFPCEYRIKVLGDADADFPNLVYKTIAAVAGDSTQAPDARPSRNGKFVSVNVSFTVESVQQLESIHQHLNATGKVKYIL